MSAENKFEEFGGIKKADPGKISKAMINAFVMSFFLVVALVAFVYALIQQTEATRTIAEKRIEIQMLKQQLELCQKDVKKGK